MQASTKTRSVAISAMLALLLSVVLAALPAAAGAQDAPDLAITAVDANAGTIEITNNGDADVDPNGIILCNFPAYAPIEGADMIPAGGSITIDSGALGVVLDPASGEMGLYTVAEYENSDAIISYVEWGEAGHKRAPVAVAAGIWAEGVADATDGVLTASTTAPSSPADWAAGSAATAETADAEPTELATTGTDAWWMTGIALALVLMGMMLVGASRRTRVL